MKGCSALGLALMLVMVAAVSVVGLGMWRGADVGQQTTIQAAARRYANSHADQYTAAGDACPYRDANCRPD